MIDVNDFRGFFISNGPVIRQQLTMHQNMPSYDSNRKPLFGICLGMQILALSQGLTTYKMHFGHRGLNHPVKT